MPDITESSRPVVALAGNPNVGKSTVFNYLTGMNQHTGNWPGKTVAGAKGTHQHRDIEFSIVDLPGTYSLLASSAEEEIARDFLCFAHPAAVIVVCDATCLERNLNLALQIREITSKVVLCVNLLDEAAKKKICIDFQKLSRLLDLPVVGASAREGKGIWELMEEVYALVTGKRPETAGGLQAFFRVSSGPAAQEGFWKMPALPPWSFGKLRREPASGILQERLSRQRRTVPAGSLFPILLLWKRQFAGSSPI